MKKTKKKKRQTTWAIDIRSVSKEYQLHHEKPTFVEKFFSRTKKEVFTALSQVTLKIPVGQRVGIVGHNGSGKTTLLKMICGISHPTQGSVRTHGRVISLIDLEAGFHPEMNGYENIYLNGLVIGMSREEISEKLSEIIAYADIGTFIDAPLYTYSEGMKLRLGFSVAVHADPDVLVLDEAIATGDAGFQEKSMSTIDGFFRAGKTVILVSHILPFLERVCERIVWLDHGKVRADHGISLLHEYKKSWDHQ